MRTMCVRGPAATASRSRRAPRTSSWLVRVGRLTPALLALIAAPALAAESIVAPVYKCTQPGGTVLYADYPCKGGAAVDIRPGVAAPDASEQLARARDEIDRAAAQRQAIDAAIALRSRETDWQRDAMAAQPAGATAYAPDTSYVPAYGYYGRHASAHAHRPKPRRVDPPRIADRRVPAVIRRPSP